MKRTVSWPRNITKHVKLSAKLLAPNCTPRTVKHLDQAPWPGDKAQLRVERCGGVAPVSFGTHLRHSTYDKMLAYVNSIIY